MGSGELMVGIGFGVASLKMMEIVWRFHGKELNNVD